MLKHLILIKTLYNDPQCFKRKRGSRRWDRAVAQVPKALTRLLWATNIRSKHQTIYTISYNVEFPYAFNPPRTHARAHVHTYVYICTYAARPVHCAYMHTYVHACMHVCIHADMQTCTQAHIRACMHADMHTWTHAHMQTCEHAYICMYLRFANKLSMTRRHPVHTRIRSIFFPNFSRTREQGRQVQGS